MEKQSTMDIPDNEPCHIVNPELWEHFCKVTNRLPGPSYVWTEADVVQALDEIEAKKANRTYRAMSAILHANEL